MFAFIKKVLYFFFIAILLYSGVTFFLNFQTNMAFVQWASEVSTLCKEHDGKAQIFRTFDDVNDNIFHANCLKDNGIVFTRKFVYGKD